jgi:hypothetical protein
LPNTAARRIGEKANIRQRYRVDLPAWKFDKPAGPRAGGTEFTRVIDAELPQGESSLDAQALLEERRKERVRRFMEDSLSAIAQDEAPPLAKPDELCVKTHHRPSGR